MPQIPTAKKVVPPHPTALESHLPSLDGMRALSILLVIGFHAQLSYGYDSYWAGYLGNLGVSTFFVISGLLITWLMIRERDATGSFSLSNFYIRRFFRIIPVYWLLLLAVIALKATHLASISWLDILRALMFTHNYPFSLHHPQEYSWWLAHTWSLSLEEQFYLVWPFLFAFLPKKLTAKIAVILIFLGPVLRLFKHHLFPTISGIDGMESHIDTLMAGCASAFLLDSPAWPNRIRKVPVRPLLIATSLFLFVANPLLANYYPPHSHLNALHHVLPTFAAVAIASTLLALVAGSQGSTFRIVNLPIARHIGKLSYSLYIWQELFLSPGAVTGLLSLTGRLVATYAVAFCSFNFVERPFVRLRSYFRRGISV